MMKGFLKRLFGKRDSVAAQIASPVLGDHTVLASPCADSQPRIRQEDSREWDHQAEERAASAGFDRHYSAQDGPMPGVRYRAGNRIGGRYEVLDIFGGPGKSGMGVVYKCFDHWDRRPCALKSFQDQPVWSKEAAETFQREAKLWIGVGHHPHIVAARTIRKPDGRLYLVLEYIAPDSKGRNCLTHYLTGYPLPVEQILTWAVRFCWGMEHAVKNGIRSHRDIKPDNIMIDDEGCLKITDFGLAKSLDGLSHLPGQAAVPRMAQTLSLVATEKGCMCGSPPWMPPEQFGRADEADARSDVYSFGVVLFQMLTGGRLPFQASSRATLKEYVEEYRQLHSRAPVPPLDSPLFPVVERCLGKAPDARYPDFTALRAALEMHADDVGMHVPEYHDLPETAERLKDWASSLCYLERYDEALGFADRAIETDPQLVAAWINRSLCCLLLSEMARTRENVAEETQFASLARDSAQKAVELDQDSALAWNNLACARRRLGEWDHAFAAARNAVELDAKFSDGWITLGGLYHSTASSSSDYQKAVECYGKAVDIAPYFFDGWMNLASTHSAVRNATEALRCYERAVEIDPENSEACRRCDAFRAALGRQTEYPVD